MRLLFERFDSAYDLAYDFALALTLTLTRIRTLPLTIPLNQCLERSALLPSETSTYGVGEEARISRVIMKGCT